MRELDVNCEYANGTNTHSRNILYSLFVFKNQKCVRLCMCVSVAVCMCICVCNEYTRVVEPKNFVCTHKKDIASLMPHSRTPKQFVCICQSVEKKLRAVIMQISFRVSATQPESDPEPGQTSFRYLK